MADVLSIANRSLLAVGARAQISSVFPSDGSDEGNAVNTLWTPTFESLARTAQWNCLRNQVVLSLLAAAQGTPENPDGTSLPIPQQPWLYSYAYPSDCLTMRFVVPSFPGNVGGAPPTTASNGAGTWIPTGGQIPYQVSYNPDNNNSATIVILTNQEQATACYTVNQPNPATWDSLFQSAMVASLGAYLVPALSLNMQLMDRCVKMAEQAIGTARMADGNEGVTTMDHVPDWMQARLGGQGWGPGGGWNATYGAGEMIWPGFYNGGSYG